MKEQHADKVTLIQMWHMDGLSDSHVLCEQLL